MATLVTAAGRTGEHPYPEPHPQDYSSNVLRLFVEGLARRREAQVLDAGPVCSENINFFAQRVKRLYVCDLFLRLDRYGRKGLPPSRALRHLDYPPQSFDGILLWELIDRLDDRDVSTLAELCHTMVRPRGLVMVIVLGEHIVPPMVNSFVIGDGFRLYPRHQPHLDLPLHGGRQNRDVLAMWTPFKPFKSFIYRNGLREFLFQHD